MAGSSNGARRSAYSKLRCVAAPAAAARAPAAVEEPVVHHAQPIAIVVPENQIVLCRYTECNRNHGVAYGRHAVDGCGEFICHVNDPYACLACGCHRSFHKKEPADVNNYRNPAAVADAVAAAARRPVPPAPQPIVAPALPPMRLATPNGVTAAGGSEVVKKGKRTMLTKDQKKNMIAFAEKIGWSSRRQDADEIHDFCNGIGITMRVFIVWLNNNRRNHRNKNGSA